jgi:general secretion pathway protein A
MNLLEYWNLEKHPFEGTCDENFYYESEDHSEALHRLRFIIENRNMNMGLLTGEIGTGKTLLGNIIKNEIFTNTENYLVYFPSSAFDFVNIMRGVIAKLQGISPKDLPANKFDLMHEFEDFIEKNVLPNQSQIVLIFDEAQGIAKEDLDNIKNLTNTGNENQLAVTVIFIGEPRLRQIITSMPQIDQRVSIRYHLNYMNKLDTYKYIRHRILIGNNKKSDFIFTNEAVDLIYQNSRGIPREINRACKLALEYGYGMQLTKITKKDVQLIFNDIKNDYRVAV